MTVTGHSTKKLDLSGQKFGKLTVLAPAENIGARTAWLCQCDCGNQVVVKTNRLRNGHAKSCGCIYAVSIAKRLNYTNGTCVEMLRAKTVRRNNTSGVPGVEWLKTKGRWRATICFQGKRHYLGSFPDFESAVQARKTAEKNLHERFVNDFDQKFS